MFRVRVGSCSGALFRRAQVMPSVLVAALPARQAAITLDAAVRSQPTINPWDKEAMYRVLSGTQQANPSPDLSKLVTALPAVSGESWAIYLSHIIDTQETAAPALAAAAKRVRGA